jgi:hypothetical protein
MNKMAELKGSMENPPKRGLDSLAQESLGRAMDLRKSVEALKGDLFGHFPNGEHVGSPDEPMGIQDKLMMTCGVLGSIERLLAEIIDGTRS